VRCDVEAGTTWEIGAEELEYEYEYEYEHEHEYEGRTEKREEN
jgi:hypothetical protein